MNQLPEELKLHIFTYMKVLGPELKPLLEINKEIRKLLWEREFKLNSYPYLSGESVACICHSFLEFTRDLMEQKKEAEKIKILWEDNYDSDEFTMSWEDNYEVEEIEHSSYMNFPPL
jgi:hypothetical protein